MIVFFFSQKKSLFSGNPPPELKPICDHDASRLEKENALKYNFCILFAQAHFSLQILQSACLFTENPDMN